MGDLEQLKEVVDGDTQALSKCKDYDGRTPLHLSASEGQQHVVQWLLDNGADPNPLDRYKGTPLQDALRQGKLETAKTLLAKGGKLYEDGKFLSLEEHSALAPANGREWEIDLEEVEDETIHSTKLGKGTIGSVYKMRWRGTVVAVKQLNEDLVSDAEALALFRLELGIVCSLAHPNIVQFLGACTTSRPYTIVTEYMGGRSLSQLLARHKASGTFIPITKALAICLDCCRGMAYLHGKHPHGIIHRDLNPDNILFDEGGKAKISDFGWSRNVLVVESEPKFLEDLPGGMARLVYVAPEITRNESYSKKIDVYSFAMIMYEMFEGRRPFAEEENFKIAAQKASEGIRPKFESRRVPPEVVELIEEMWDDDPDHRPDFYVCVDRLYLMRKEALSKPADVGSSQCGCTIS